MFLTMRNLGTPVGNGLTTHFTDARTLSSMHMTMCIHYIPLAKDSPHTL